MYEQAKDNIPRLQSMTNLETSQMFNAKDFKSAKPIRYVSPKVRGLTDMLDIDYRN